MKSLLAAIKSRFDAASLSATFPGGYWPNYAKSGSAMPYLVATTIAAPLTESYGGTKHAEAVIQFSAFAKATSTTSPEDAALTAIEAWAAALDGQTLTISGGTMIDLYREGDPVVMRMPAEGPEPDESAVDVASATVTYRIAVQ